MQQEIATLLQTEMKDPRLTLVTVTRVNIDRELEYANVFVSTVGDADRRDEVMRVLNGARGYIRREVAHRIQLRRAPEIKFHWDPSPEKAEAVNQLLDELQAEAQAHVAPNSPKAPEQEAPEPEGADESEPPAFEAGESDAAAAETDDER